jgi:hypothetical protein
MNSLVKDRTGIRYGKLVVMEFAGSPPPKYNAMWRCACDCGKETVVVGHKLGKDTKSCGCLKVEATQKAKTTHGESRGKNVTYLYRAWCNAKSRCKPTWIEPWNYFDRGIKVCDEWIHDYPAFRDWVINNIGHRPAQRGWSIDRIDNDKGYEPGNIRWATDTRQVRNTRKNIRVSYRGKTGVLKDICEEHGLDFKLILGRIHNGMSFDDAVKYPKNYWRRKPHKRNRTQNHLPEPPQPSP